MPAKKKAKAAPKKSSVKKSSSKIKYDVDKINSGKPNKREFRILIWNDTINKVFMTFLILTVVILSGLTYVQNIYIHQLEKKATSSTSFIDVSKINYEVIPLEDYEIEEGFAGSIADLNLHLVRNGYENIIIQKGFIQGEKITCETNGCTKTTLRFNQRKGKYIDLIYESVDVENK